MQGDMMNVVSELGISAHLMELEILL
jgi:hypothetical protein